MKGQKTWRIEYLTYLERENGGETNIWRMLAENFLKQVKVALHIKQDTFFKITPRYVVKLQILRKKTSPTKKNHADRDISTAI